MRLAAPPEAGRGRDGYAVARCASPGTGSSGDELEDRDQLPLLSVRSRLCSRVDRCRWRERTVDVRLSDGPFLVEGRTVTGFAHTGEAAADEAVGTKVMPWRIADALRQRGANYVEGRLWKAVAIGDGRLITGQQQYSDPRSPRESPP